jgi:hypothetical protein
LYAEKCSLYRTTGKAQNPVIPTVGSRFYLFVVTVPREEAGHIFSFALLRREQKQERKSFKSKREVLHETLNLRLAENAETAKH